MKKTLFYLKIKKSFVLNYPLPRNAPKTTQEDPCVRLGKLGHGWACLDTPNQK